MQRIYKLVIGLGLLLCSALTYGQTELFPVHDNGFWGYITSDGDVRISPKFDMAYEFRNGVAIVELNGQQMLINQDAQRLTPKSIDDFRLVNNRLIVRQQDQYGLSDLRGNLIVNPQYASITPTEVDGIFRFADKSAFGLMDSMGNILVPKIYDNISEYEGIFWMLPKGETEEYSFYLPTSGIHLEEHFSDIRIMGDQIFVMNVKEEWNVLSPGTQELSEYNWSYLNLINESYFLAVEKKDTILYAASSLHPIATNMGFVEGIDTNRLVLNHMNNRHIVFGDSLLLDTFEAVGLLEDKTYLVYKNNLANLLDSNLEPLLEWKYTWIDLANPTWIRASNGVGIGLVSKLDYSEALNCSKSYLVVLDRQIKTLNEQNELVLYSHKEGQITDSLHFKNHKTLVANSLSLFGSGTMGDNVQRMGRWFNHKKRWGYRAPDGKVLIPPIFSSYKQLPNSPYTTVVRSVISSKTGRLLARYIGLVDESQGKAVLSPRYAYIDTTDINNINLEVIRARRSSGGFDLVNKISGQIVVQNTPFIDEFINGRARIYVNGRLSYTEDPNQYKEFDQANTFCAQYNLSLGKAFDRMLGYVNRRYRQKTLLVYAVGGHWDYVDRYGQFLLRDKSIRYAEPFDPVNAVVTRGDSCALINRNGQLLTDFDYLNIQKLEIRDSSFYAVTTTSPSCNYYKAGGEKIGNTYVFGSDLNDGAAWIKHNGSFAILRDDGKIVELESDVYPYRNTFNQGYSPVRKGRNWTLIDTTGKIVADLQRGRITWSSEGYYSRRVLQVNSRGKRTKGYQLFEIGGYPLSNKLYNRTEPFYHGYSEVRTRSNKRTIVSNTGFQISKSRFDKFYGFEESGLSLLRKNGKYGVFSSCGRFIVPCRYSKVYFSDSAILAYKGRVLSVFDREGKRIAKFKGVTSFTAYEEGLAMVRIDRKSGYINEQGQWHIEPTYKYATGFSDGAAVVLTETSGYMSINRDGSPISGINLSRRPTYSKGVIIQKTALGYAYYNKYGKLISQDYYDKAYPFENGYAKVFKKGKWGLINTIGEYILPIEYSRIRINDKGEISAQKSVSYGLLNVNGRVVVEPTFDKIEYNAKHNMYVLKYGHIPGYLNTRGAWVWKQNRLTGL